MVAKDIMTQNVITVGGDTPVKDLAQRLSRTGSAACRSSIRAERFSASFPRPIFSRSKAREREIS